MYSELVEEVLEDINEEWQRLKSNILNIQESKDTAMYKLNKQLFWTSVIHLLVFGVVLMFLTVIPVIICVAILGLVGIFIGAEALIVLLFVAVLVYALFKSGVLYRILYSLIKK